MVSLASIAIAHTLSYSKLHLVKISCSSNWVDLHSLLFHDTNDKNYMYIVSAGHPYSHNYEKFKFVNNNLGKSTLFAPISKEINDNNF